MPIYRGTQLVTPRPGGQSVARVYRGDRLVWQAGLPVVQITEGTALNVAGRDQFRQALVDYGATYQTVERLPFALDVSQVQYIRYLFQGCAALTEVLIFDTSHILSMEGLFSGCTSLTVAPALDTVSVGTVGTSTVANMNSMFLNCTSLTHVPDLNTANCQRFYDMFSGCTSLTDGNVRLIGKHPNADTFRMILGSGLTREPFFDTNGNPI